MSELLDLDAAKAARADHESQPLPIKIGGQTFEVARPLRVSVAVAVAEGNVSVAVREMFGDNARAVLDAGLDLHDLRLVVDGLLSDAAEQMQERGSGNAPDASSV